MALNVIEPGWLYVIANPAMPRVCKVGFTTREPEERAAERGAHAALARFRTDAGREWFALPADRAVQALDRLHGSTTRATFTRRLWRILRGIVEGLGWLTLALLIAGI